jgi:CheY-like chemotaxis protein
VLHEDVRVVPLLSRHVEGREFVAAETPEKARELVQERCPEAVLVDSGWAETWDEGASGLGWPDETLQVTCQLPSLRREGLLLGAVDYLPKPVTRAGLEKALGRLRRPPETVLVVDDEPRIVRLLARMLKASKPSLRVQKAFGGEEGLQIIRQQRPDLVLLDMLMADLNGYAILDALAADPALAETQVIIVSVRSIQQEAAPLAGDLRLQRGAGFSVTELLQMLQAVLPGTTRPAAAPPASAGALQATRPG